MKLAVAYTIFSILSMVANLGTQELVLWNESSSQSVFISVMVGTGVGLIVKYILDKRYIFFFHCTQCCPRGSNTYFIHINGVFDDVLSLID